MLALILLAANLLPLVGVVFWGWDAFVILILYWLETAIIGGWTVVRVLVMSPADRAALNFRAGGADGRPAGRVGTALFLTVHAGIFMTVHFLFLWTLFAGDWPARVHGPGDFVRDLVVGTGLWLPLLVLFFVRGWMVLGPVLRSRFAFLPAGAVPADGDPTAILGLYLRIFVMQITIILGGWVAMLSGGSIGALVLLVVAKTLGELYFGPLTRQVDEAARKAAAGRAAAAAQPAPPTAEEPPKR